MKAERAKKKKVCKKLAVLKSNIWSTFLFCTLYNFQIKYLTFISLAKSSEYINGATIDEESLILTWLSVFKCNYDIVRVWKAWRNRKARRKELCRQSSTYKLNIWLATSSFFATQSFQIEYLPFKPFFFPCDHLPTSTSLILAVIKFYLHYHFLWIFDLYSSPYNFSLTPFVSI